MNGRLLGKRILGNFKKRMPNSPRPRPISRREPDFGRVKKASAGRSLGANHYQRLLARELDPTPGPQQRRTRTLSSPGTMPVPKIGRGQLPRGTLARRLVVFGMRLRCCGNGGGSPAATRLVVPPFPTAPSATTAATAALAAITSSAAISTAIITAARSRPHPRHHHRSARRSRFRRALSAPPCARASLGPCRRSRCISPRSSRRSSRRLRSG